MFFTHDRSFEEFFCICIQLLNKTWKEMRATSEDFNKVGLMASLLWSGLDVFRLTINFICGYSYVKK